MNVLSLFDGMSCGQQALERAGIKVENYFASEIDKYAIQVTMANYPNTKQLGSVVDVNAVDLPKIDLLIGGSPCQSFSFAGKRKGMSTKDEQEILTLEHYLELKAEGFEFEGQSYLFWEFMRLLNETKPKYFLLENVEMGEKWEKVLSKAIGVNGIHINSALVSAQNRKRIYWTNIGMLSKGLFGNLESIIEQPEDKGILLKDILQDNINSNYYLSDKMVDYVSKSGTKNFYYKPKFANLEGKAKPIVTKHIYRAGTTNYICEKVDEKYYLSDKVTKRYKDVESKSYVGTTAPLFRTIGQRDIVYGEHNKMGCLVATDYKQPKQVIINNKIRRLTPLECERLQTVKDNYTNFVSDTQRYRMLGNGWTVDVIAHIFSYII
jgi:DNA (cytosine-5)-methyltransferase 3A